jgi:Fe-S cluster biogenesis protein NfuA
MGNREELISRIKVALDEIRPFLKSDGGDISLEDLSDDMVVTVKLHGACINCSVNQMTLKSGVEMTIKKHAPEISKVVEVGLTQQA